MDAPRQVRVAVLAAALSTVLATGMAVTAASASTTPAPPAPPACAPAGPESSAPPPRAPELPELAEHPARSARRRATSAGSAGGRAGEERSTVGSPHARDRVTLGKGDSFGWADSADLLRRRVMQLTLGTWTPDGVPEHSSSGWCTGEEESRMYPITGLPAPGRVLRSRASPTAADGVVP